MTTNTENDIGETGRVHPTFFLLGILLVIQLRGDGYFPFPKTWPQPWLMVIVFAHTLFLFCFVLLSVRWLVSEKTISPPAILRMTRVTCGLIPLGAILGICALHFLQAGHFSERGYISDNSVLLRVLLLSVIPLIVYWFFFLLRKHHSPLLFLACVLMSSLLLKAIPLELFPITAKRSDMLPILKEGALSLYRGENPYQYYILDNGIKTPNVRFPGLILAYFPAVIARFDLRIITLLFEMATFVLFLFVARNNLTVASEQDNKAHWYFLVPLTCFILLPYWHYRHELYELPFWLVVFVTFMMFEKENALGFGFCLGVMSVTHQWGMLFWPFMLLGFYGKKGLKSAGLSLLVGSVLCAALMVMFLGGKFDAFYQHTFGTYEGYSPETELYPLSMYFSSLLARLGFYEWLFPVKVLAQIPVLYMAYNYGRSVHALAGILAISLTLVLMFNPVAWTYQYLLVVFLLLVGWMFRFARQDG